MTDLNPVASSRGVPCKSHNFHYFYFLSRVKTYIASSAKMISKRTCSTCEKLVCPASFSRHLRSHSNKFKCDQCPSLIFNRRDNLIRHLKVHHPLNDDDYESSSIPQDHSAIVESAPFIIKEEILKENLGNFSISLPQFTTQADTSNFIHPFSCKIVGPRGSGKTSFAISYIEKIACLTFPKIFIVTTSHDQPLYDLLKDNKQVYFITLEELDSAVKSHKESLVVLDDVMQEARFNNTLQAVFTKGRHQRISIMSLEQDLFYSNPIERRNVDYYVLMRMRDTSSLIQFYKRFCIDVQQWRFIDIYEYSVEKPLGYLIVDFVSHKYKYRINSLNLYLDVESMKIECIDKAFSSVAKDKARTQLQQRFMFSLADLKSGRKHCETGTFNKIKVDEQEEPTNPKDGQTTAHRSICKICHEDYYNPEALQIHYGMDHKEDDD